MVRDEAIELLTHATLKTADWIGRRYWRHFQIRRRRSPSAPSVKIIAHRGAWKSSGLIENTLPALNAAVAAGCWGIEFDVRPLRDHTLVVHHDDSLARTFGRPLHLSQISFAHLRHEVPLIPTLEEVIAALRGKVHLLIELKGTKADWPKQTIAQLDALLNAQQCGHDFHLMGLDPELLRHVVQHCPHFKTGIVGIATTNVQDVSNVVLKENWAAFTAHWLLMSQSLIDTHHQQGQLCGTGYADSKEVFNREYARDTDWIFTNHGHEAPSWLDEKSRSQ